METTPLWGVREPVLSPSFAGRPPSNGGIWLRWALRAALPLPEAGGVLPFGVTHPGVGSRQRVLVDRKRLTFPPSPLPGPRDSNAESGREAPEWAGAPRSQPMLPRPSVPHDRQPVRVSCW